MTLTDKQEKILRWLGEDPTRKSECRESEESEVGNLYYIGLVTYCEHYCHINITPEGIKYLEAQNAIT